MSDDKQSMTISVGEQQFRVRVPASEVERYERIAAHANQVLDQVVASGAFAGPRALSMALFQLAAEFNDAREAVTNTQQSSERLKQLIERIDQATEAAETASDAKPDTKSELF